eukprot:690053-Amphidinium_carterae.2
MSKPGGPQTVVTTPQQNKAKNMPETLRAVAQAISSTGNKAHPASSWASSSNVKLAADQTSGKSLG